MAVFAYLNIFGNPNLTLSRAEILNLLRTDQKLFSAFSIDPKSLRLSDDNARQVWQEVGPDCLQDVALPGEGHEESSGSLPLQLLPDAPEFFDAFRRLLVTVDNLICRRSNALSNIFWRFRRLRLIFWRQTVDFFDHSCRYHFWTRKNPLLIHFIH